MLVSLSTQLARGKRKAKTLLFLPIATLEQAAAALRAAEHMNHALILVLNATKPLLFSLNTFVGALSLLATEAQAEVSIGIVSGPTHTAVEHVLQAGAQFIIPTQGSSEEQFASLLSWSAEQAHSRNVEVILSASSFTALEKLATLLPTANLSATILPAETLRVNGAVNRALFKTVFTTTKLPLIVGFQQDPMPPEIHQLVKAGAAGIVVDNEFDSAFTAGVRAALHNHSLTDPLTYLNKGSLAVEDKLARYLQILCSM